MKWNYRNLPYGMDRKQKLDIIIPQKKEAHAIVYIHGGAFMIGKKSQYPSFLQEYAKDAIVATIDYRLINKDNNIELKDMLFDIRDALQKIIELSYKHNVCIKDFILMGHSAGGHIALLYGYKYHQKYKNIKIAACISLSGITDFTDYSGWLSMRFWGKNVKSRLSFLSDIITRLTGKIITLKQFDWTKQNNYPLFRKYIINISPIAYVKKTETVPSTLLVHSQKDDQVPYSNAVRLNAILDNSSVSHKLITATGKEDNHVLGGAVFNSPLSKLMKEKRWVTESKKWLEMYLS